MAHIICVFLLRCTLDRYYYVRLFSLTLAVWFSEVFLLFYLGDATPTAKLIGVAVFLLTTYFGVAVMVARLRYRGYSGWWALVLFIPYVGLTIAFLLMKRTDEEKARDQAQYWE